MKPQMFADGETPTRSVAENTVPNANIGLPVVATDVDSDDTWTYGLSGPDAASFAIVDVGIVDDADGGGQLKTKAALDYETKHDYEVTVTATDAGGETGTIRVIITLINDETDGDTAVANSAPRFNDGPSTTRSVAENTAAKENIVDLVAVMDTEDPDGDTLTYDLIGTDAASFDIVAGPAGTAGGQLQTKAELDYETKTSYMVMVTVTDGKDAEDNVDPTVDDTIRVTIMVTDENEAPEFPAETATRSVAENTVPDANIGNPVVAMDVDDGDTLTYMLGNTTDDDAFAIVATTGQLKTKEALDYETKTDYEVTVTASDSDSDMKPIQSGSLSTLGMSQFAMATQK